MCYMKKSISIIVFTALSLSAFSQVEIEKPERSESDRKTEFRYSIFQTNYLTQNILIQFLDQDRDQISSNSKYVKLKAKDLFYERSGHFDRNENIESWLKDKYLTSEKRKIELLDSALGISKKWQASIIEDNLLDEILKPIFHKYNITVKNNIIYGVGPISKDNFQRTIYKFEFNDDKKIISKNAGLLTNRNDSLYWITSTFEYKNNQLRKEVNKKCQDHKCAKGYDLEIIIYEEGKISKSTKQKFSRHNNDFVEEEIADYRYSHSELDSTIINTYQIRKLKPKLHKIAVRKYSKGNITGCKEVYLSPQVYRDQKSELQNKYDRKNRLISSEYRSWDSSNEISQIRIEEFEYQKNKYTYRYKQSLIKERGKEKLPLQYELTYSFY